MLHECYGSLTALLLEKAVVGDFWAAAIENGYYDSTSNQGSKRIKKAQQYWKAVPPPQTSTGVSRCVV
jgi:hypothetical protein